MNKQINRKNLEEFSLLLTYEKVTAKHHEPSPNIRSADTQILNSVASTGEKWISAPKKAPSLY